MSRHVKNAVAVAFCSLFACGLLVTSFGEVQASSSYVEPVLLGDINSEASSSEISTVGTVNGTLVFWLKNSVNRGLWRSDGTKEGTFALKLITVDAYSQKEASVLLGGSLYFLVRSSQGIELWKTDGSVNGTNPVKFLGDEGPSTDIEMIVYDSHIYFSVSTASYGHELWKSDGTEQGTFLFMDLVPGDVGSLVSGLAVFSGRLIFAARNPQLELLIWRSDGTVSGTSPLFLNWSITWPVHIQNIDNSFLLVSSNYFHGLNKISTSWTRTQLATVDSAQRFVKCGSLVCFEANGHQIWSTNGTVASTTLLKSFVLAGSETIKVGESQTLANKAYFALESDNASASGTWVTDGSVSGTSKFSDIAPIGSIGATSTQIYVESDQEILRSNGIDTPSVVRDGFFADLDYLSHSVWLDTPRNRILAILGNSVLFTADNGTNGSEIWITSDASEGASMVRDISVGTSDSDNASCYEEPAMINGGLLTSDSRGRQTWGIHLRSLADQNTTLLEQTVSRSSSPFAHLSTLGNSFLYSLDGNPWRSDGGVGSGTLLKRIATGNYGSIGKFVEFGNQKIFFASPGTDSGQTSDGSMWITDGTSQGTTRLTDAVDGRYEVLGEYLYYHARNSQQIISLWRLRIADSVRSEVAVGTYELMVVAGQLFIERQDDESADSLQKVDLVSGIATRFLGPFSDTWQGHFNSNWTLAVPGGLFMSSNDPASNVGLWFSDGTNSGTRPISAINAGTSLSFGVSLGSIGSRMVALMSNQEFGYEPWIIDGSLGVAKLLVDATPGPDRSWFTDFCASSTSNHEINGFIYFDLRTDLTKSQVWRTDGTSAGTRQITNFPQITGHDWAVHHVISSGNNVYFGAASPTVGQEMWAFDTRLIPNSAVSVTSSSIQNLPENSGAQVPTATSMPTNTSIEVTTPVPSQLVSSSTSNPIVVSSNDVSVSRILVLPSVPSRSFAKNVAVVLNGSKVVITLEPSTFSTKPAAISKYIIELRPKTGKSIFKTVVVAPNKIFKPSISVRKNTKFQLLITAVQKSGKKLNWKGPSFSSQ